MTVEGFKIPEMNREIPRYLQAYVFRHGKTAYKEREVMKKDKKFAPDLDDLTEEGKDGVKANAELVAQEIDPQKNIVVFLSSPRARAQTTMRVIEDVLRSKGVEIFESPRVVEVLRSGGDFSSVVGEENKITSVPSKKNSEDKKDIIEEESQKSEGIRFRQFLRFLGSIGKEPLSKKISSPDSGFHNKIPVFIAVTHGEVVHAGNYSDTDYRASFLGQIYKGSDKRVKLHRGNFLKFNFDLEHPGKASVIVPPDTSPNQEEEKVNFEINKFIDSISIE